MSPDTALKRIHHSCNFSQQQKTILQTEINAKETELQPRGTGRNKWSLLFPNVILGKGPCRITTVEAHTANVCGHASRTGSWGQDSQDVSFLSLTLVEPWSSARCSCVKRCTETQCWCWRLLIRQSLQDVCLLACLLIYKSSSPHFPSASPSSLSERSAADLPPLPALSRDLSAWLQETAKSRFKRKETVESETQGSYCVEWVWWRLLKGHPFLPPFPSSAFCPHPRLLLILLGGYIGRKKEIIIMNGCVPWHMNNSFLSRDSGIKIRGFKSH